LKLPLHYYHICGRLSPLGRGLRQMGGSPADIDFHRYEKEFDSVQDVFELQVCITPVEWTSGLKETNPGNSEI